jgi:hypothetical protein
MPDSGRPRRTCVRTPITGFDFDAENDRRVFSRIIGTGVKFGMSSGAGVHATVSGLSSISNQGDGMRCSESTAFTLSNSILLGIPEMVCLHSTRARSRSEWAMNSTGPGPGTVSRASA